MKILVLTKYEYFDFMLSFVCDNEHEISIVCHESSDMFKDYDIGVSFMWTKRIPKEQLDHTWYNFHPAPLPEYRGRNLCYHAIMNREKYFGATFHYMDENFDTGRIIDVWKFEIKSNWTSQDLSDRTIEESKQMFANFFPKILAGENFLSYDNKGGTYYKKEPIKDEIYLFENQMDAVLAITYGNFYPKVNIRGTKYKIVRDE